MGATPFGEEVESRK